MKEIAIEEVREMNYLEYKVQLLCQLGLTDTDKVKHHLAERCANAQTESKKRIQIDNAARKIMMDYYDGDRTFVFKGPKKKKTNTSKVLH